METFPQVVTVKDQSQGLNYTKEILYKKSDNQTLLLLSGGSTPRNLYETLAHEKKLTVGAVGMVDERADRSNFEMIKKTGLLSYFEEEKVPFGPILQLHPKGVASDFAKDYGGQIKHLLGHYSKSIAIMGIGEDGHTAGLPSGIFNSQFPISNNEDLVTNIDNFPGEFRERITLTFKALSQMDLLIILAFGSSKQNALKKMFDPTDSSGQEAMEEIPARFYLRPDIAPKTILITDQKI
ncbi:MAG: 6-phosphogluconolactonase [bacterium]|nr:6-phosphogluconolactonase [bacterium]